MTSLVALTPETASSEPFRPWNLGKLIGQKPPMTLKLLVFYGSYRSDRAGIRLADYTVGQLAACGHEVELIDAKAVGIPMLDRMFKEYAPDQAPETMATLTGKIRAADGFVFVAGEYNWGVQPGLKNLTDHFMEEWFWRPAAILSYSAGRIGGVRSGLIWHGTLSEMGMVVISSTIAVGGIGWALTSDGTPTGESGQALTAQFPRFAADLEWWAEAAKRYRAEQVPPY